MTNQNNRRGFLRGLVTLPLIGGGVTLIGNPTAAAEPITPKLLACYSNWLHMERRLVCMEMFPELGPRAEDFILHSTGANNFHFPHGKAWNEAQQPSSRAALVLSTVGCDWRQDRDPIGFGEAER